MCEQYATFYLVLFSNKNGTVIKVLDAKTEHFAVVLTWSSISSDGESLPYATAYNLRTFCCNADSD